jgi:hypothetical protein
LRFGFFYFGHVPLSLATISLAQKTLVKTKSPRVQVFWHVGFGISFYTEVLGPQQPQARNVMFATATAIAATTHGLASHWHQLKEYVSWFVVSMPSFSSKNTDSDQQIFGREQVLESYV